MKWFDQWFARKCRWAWENKGILDSDGPVIKEQSISIGLDEPSPSWGDGLRINVRKVIGGSVVSFRTYDRVRDRSDERHYIITDEQEFDRELGKIITMESMRQS